MSRFNLRSHLIFRVSLQERTSQVPRAHKLTDSRANHDPYSICAPLTIYKKINKKTKFFGRTRLSRKFVITPVVQPSKMAHHPGSHYFLLLARGQQMAHPCFKLYRQISPSCSRSLPPQPSQPHLSRRAARKVQRPSWYNT